MYHLIYESYITGVFCILFTYVLLGNKYLLIVIAVVIVIKSTYFTLFLIKYINVVFILETETT